MTLIKQLWRFINMARRVGGWQAVTTQAPKQIALFRLLLADPRVPPIAKAVLVGAVAFAVSPLNIPNYIPVLGALDDIGIALFAINFFLKQVPAPVLAEHRQRVGLSAKPDFA